MEAALETLTRGNVAAVKTVLSTVIVALAVYQVVLMAVGYGKVRPRFLQPKSASVAHRGIGDAIVVLAVVVAAMCLGVFGIGEAVDEGATTVVHAIAGALVLAVLGLKLLVLHRWHHLGRYLPVLGLSVFALFAVTWLTSAGDRLAG